MNPLHIRPLAASLGATISGIDLSRPLGEQQQRELRTAFWQYLVLFFHDQHLEPEQQLALTRVFGDVLRVPYVQGMAQHPDVIAVVKEADERNISTFGGQWHSDFSFLEAPPAGSVLFAREVPPVGGDTLWLNAYAAYESLSKGIKKLLDGRRAVHSGWPYGVHARPDPHSVSRSIAMTRGDPDADRERLHPVVRVHPDTGRKALFVNPIYTVRLEGMSDAESRPLLDLLYAHATRPEFSCRFVWHAGSVAIWDNRCCMHYAMNDYDGYRRELYRTTFAGEPPSAGRSAL